MNKITEQQIIKLFRTSDKNSDDLKAIINFVAIKSLENLGVNPDKVELIFHEIMPNGECYASASPFGEYMVFYFDSLRDALKKCEFDRATNWGRTLILIVAHETKHIFDSLRSQEKIFEKKFPEIRDLIHIQENLACSIVPKELYIKRHYSFIFEMEAEFYAVEFLKEFGKKVIPDEFNESGELKPLEESNTIFESVFSNLPSYKIGFAERKQAYKFFKDGSDFVPMGENDILFSLLADYFMTNPLDSFEYFPILKLKYNENPIIKKTFTEILADKELYLGKYGDKFADEINDFYETMINMDMEFSLERYSSEIFNGKSEFQPHEMCQLISTMSKMNTAECMKFKCDILDFMDDDKKEKKIKDIIAFLDKHVINFTQKCRQTIKSIEKEFIEDEAVAKFGVLWFDKEKAVFDEKVKKAYKHS